MSESTPSSTNKITTTSAKNVSVPHLPPFNAAATGGGGGEQHKKRKKNKVKESIIDHTYRDYSQVEIPEDADDISSRKKDSQLNFPAKLHAILSNPGYQHIIGWMPHGRSWKIVDKYLLSNVILPKHFAHAKFESFNRSVNGWGFKRLLGDGPDKKTYYHECFLRGRPDLTRLMVRLCNPGKRLPDKSGEPNFYEISKNYPLPELVGTTFPPNAMTGVPQQQGPPRPLPAPSQGGAVQSSPMNAPHQQPGQQQFMMSPPHHQPQGYVYGYPPQPPAGYPPHNMGMQAAANDGSNPSPHQQQPPQPQMYWQGHPGGGSPYHHQPPPPYGYYPYHPQMMMAAAPPQQAGPAAAAGGGPPQGYYMVPYPPQPQYYPPNPNATAATVAATPDRAAAPSAMVGQPSPRMGMPVVDSGGMMPMGMGLNVQQKQNGEEKVNQMLAQAVVPKMIKKESNKEKEVAAASTVNTKVSTGVVKPVANAENSKAEGATTILRDTEESKATVDPASKENITNADSITGVGDKPKEGKEGTKPTVTQESKADEPRDAAKSTVEPNTKQEGSKEKTNVASKGSVEEEEKKEPNADDKENNTFEV